MKTLFKLTAIAAAALTLVACGGGGGGGGSVSAPQGEQYSWNQGQLNNANNTTSQDVALLNSKFGTANISAGTPELNFDGTPIRNSNGTLKYEAPAWAHNDVQAAYNKGWTGRGIGILVYDGFTDKMIPSGTASHGAVVQDVAQKVAQGAYVFGRNYESGLLNNATFVDTTRGNIPSQFTNIVNLSIGYDIADNSGLTQAQLLATTRFTNGATTWSYGQMKSANILITKAAGNGDTITDMDKDLLNVALKDSSRVIFVGNANAANTPASYTKPGSDTTYQQKFLVVNAPYTDKNGNLSQDGCPSGCYWGSSFAAPVVAGYGAIVMQKFNGISASQTAQVLLNTAKKDFGGYDVTIHGQGEASLSRALSPVGRMR